MMRVQSCSQRTYCFVNLYQSDITELTCETVCKQQLKTNKQQEKVMKLECNAAH